MEDYLKGYCEFVTPSEDERNKILIKYYSKSIFKIMLRGYYKEMLYKYDKMLMHCYEFIGKQIETD